MFKALLARARQGYRTADYPAHDPSLPPMQGREGAKQLVTLFSSAFSGLSVHVEDMLAEGDKVACRFSDGGRVLLSAFLAAHVRPGDEIDFPLAIDSAGAGTELYIRKASSRRVSDTLFHFRE